MAPHDMSIIANAERSPAVYESTNDCLLRLRYIVSCPSVPHVFIIWHMQFGFKYLFDASSVVSPVEHYTKKKAEFSTGQARSTEQQIFQTLE
jgi:hypothetical protein